MNKSLNMRQSYMTVYSTHFINSFDLFHICSVTVICFKANIVNKTYNAKTHLTNVKSIHTMAQKSNCGTEGGTKYIIAYK